MSYKKEPNKRLLIALEILFIDGSITHESYLEYDEIDKSSFSRLMNSLTQMINDLNINGSLIKSTIDNIENPNQFKKNIYYFKQIEIDYSFSLDELTEEKENEYLFVIIYLMLKNRQYIKYCILRNQLKMNLSQNKFYKIITEMKSIIAEDINKNGLMSYVLEEE